MSISSTYFRQNPIQNYNFFLLISALRRAKFKFPGRQKIFTSKKWGFTKWDREEYVERRRDGSIKPDGTNVQYYPDKGPLKQWKWREQNLLA